MRIDRSNRQWGAGLLVVGVIIVGLLFFFYHKTQAVDAHAHTLIVNSFSTLKEYEAVADRTLIETRFGLHPSYDPLVDSLSRLLRFSDRFEGQLPVDTAAELSPQLRDYHALLEEKRDRVEDFKSHNAVLINSLAYFPSLCDEFIARSNDDGAVRQINLLLQHTLNYAMNSAHSELESAHGLLSSLAVEVGGPPGSLQMVLEDIIVHGRLILRYKAHVDDLIRQVTSVPTEQAVADLQAAYFFHYQQQQAQVGLYRSLLIALSALFAAGVLGTLVGLVLALGKLRESVNSLNFQKFALDQHAIVSITDVKGGITYANQKFCDISGYSEQELMGQNHRIVKSEAHTDAFYREMWRTIAGGEVWQGEIMNRSRDGTPYWVSSTIVPFLDARGKPFQYVSIRTDITRRKQAEQGLREEREFLRSLTNALGDGVYVLDDAGRCTYLNPEGERLLGWGTQQLQGRVIHDLIHHLDSEGDNCPASRCPIMRAIRNDQVFRSDDEIFLHQGGGAFPVSVVSVPLHSEGQVSGSVTIFRDISEQKRRELELRQARDEAERASRAKSEFLSSMSHELRTPMNAILGFGQLLEVEEETIRGQNREFVEEILKAGRHLLELINEVLDLAKIESGRIDLFMEAVDCGELLEECRTLLLPLAAMRGIGLDLQSFRPGEQVVWGDRTRLKQVLINLISNAIKYNREQGRVGISILAVDGGRLQIRVADTGPGIPPERQKELFEPFTRVGDDPNTVEGTGIGLVISRRLAEMMGGGLEFESSPGNGSCFWVELPRSAVDPVETQEGQDEDRAGLETEQSIKTVLYMEDNPANLKLISVLLARLPHIQMLSAHEPGLGLELARSHRPDLIMLDINMPEMSGYEVLQLLREDADLAPIPVVAISANAMPGDIEKGNQAGFDYYLTKPIDVPKLLQIVKDFLS